MTRLFEGHSPRECGEHRSVGSHRAWCFADSEWCYPRLPCRGCEIVQLRVIAETIPSYRTVHAWLTTWRGPASGSRCADCGEPASDWAFDNREPSWPSAEGAYFPNPCRYVPLCRSCHEIRDRSTETCANGHRWADGNRYYRKDGKGTICRSCRREGMRNGRSAR